MLFFTVWLLSVVSYEFFLDQGDLTHHPGAWWNLLICCMFCVLRAPDNGHHQIHRNANNIPEQGRIEPNLLFFDTSQYYFTYSKLDCRLMDIEINSIQHNKIIILLHVMLFVAALAWLRIYAGISPFQYWQIKTTICLRLFAQNTQNLLKIHCWNFEIQNSKRFNKYSVIRLPWYNTYMHTYDVCIFYVYIYIYISYI